MLSPSPPAAGRSQLCVTCLAVDGNRYILRVSIDLDPEAIAVHDAIAGRSRYGRTATTRIRQDDAGQVAESVRNRNGDVADRNVRAGTPAGGTELRRNRRQIPAHGCALALPSHDASALLQAGANTDVSLSSPAQPVPDLIAIRRGSVRWEQSKKRNLVLAKNMTGLSHISSLSMLSASLSVSSSYRAAIPAKRKLTRQLMTVGDACGHAR